MGLVEDNEYLTAENMKLASRLVTADNKLQVYRNFVEGATLLLKEHGWLPFGTHATHQKVPPLIFSEQTGLDGLPLFERLADG